MNKNASRFRYKWLALLISLQFCVQPMLQGQESATKEKKAGETTPAENPTLPPKSADSAVPPNSQDETIEVQTPYGPMKVLKKTEQPGPQNLQPSSATPVASSATETTPPAAGTASGAQASPPAPSPTPGSTPKPPVPVEEQGSPSNVKLQLFQADLNQVINIIGNELKINYVVDPKVKGVATVSTMGEVRREDLIPLLETILRLNGAAIVKTGNFYQIVPRSDVKQLPVPIRTDSQPDARAGNADRIMQVIPMRFVSAKDMSKVLEPYLSESGSMVVHEGGNILILTETAMNLKRLLELVSIFDADVFQNKRVQLFPVKNNRAKDLASELESVFAAYALSKKDSAIRFLPIDRINAILVVSPSTTAFAEVEKWIQKLDQPGENMSIKNFVYKVQNGIAKNIAGLLTQIYAAESETSEATAAGFTPGGATAPARAVGGEVTRSHVKLLRGDIKIVADEITNSVVVQSSPQDFETIQETIRSLDAVPRQVFIDAKIYEVDLTGALSMGVSYFLQQRSTANLGTVASFSAAAVGALKAGLNVASGTIIGNSRELLVFLNAQESRQNTRILSAPTVIASDNTDARIQVGQEVPLLTSQGTIAGGTGSQGLFSNTIQNRSTGIILTVTPRINSSGWVTLKINQEVSSPVAPDPGSGIQSPSIQIRSVNTQVTVMDGETIAIGGIILESRLLSKNRIPLIGDIPGLGLLFGTTTYSKTRTELIVLITPRVIENIDQASEITDELKSTLKDIKKDLRME
jgi:general secretion pathway protein D